MRGKGGIVLNSATPKGITPAYAGKSSGNSVIKVSHKDHPRLCGEKVTI